jgi:uncharacterized damage-inducible protein DinB
MTTTSEVTRIGRLSKHAFNGEPWYGLALCKLLSGVTAEQAALHPIRAAHSIWQEVLHAITWRKVTINLLNGKPEPRDINEIEELNWPTPTETSAAAWRRTLDDLAETQRQLEAAIAGVSDDRLSEKAPEKPFSLYVLMHGIIQHDAYHAGQIALLKNACAAS